MTLTGTVTAFEWRNPHSTLNIEVKDTAGRVTRWALELDNPSVLTGLGWTMSQFKAGDRVSADGWAAKDGTRRLSTKTVTSNGKALFATTTFFDAPTAARAAAAGRTSASNPAEVMLVGCVEREADYRQARNAGRGGVLGTGVGVGDEFVLTRTTQPMAATSTKPIGTAGGTDNVFALTGDLEGDVLRGLGRQVLIVGVVEADNTLPRINVTLWHPIGDFCPGR